MVDTYYIIWHTLNATTWCIKNQNIFCVYSLFRDFYIDKGPFKRIPKCPNGGRDRAETPLRNRHQEHTMNRLKNMKAQNLIEYAIVVALVSAAIAAMSTYVFRSVQATQKAVDTEFAVQ